MTLSSSRARAHRFSIPLICLLAVVVQTQVVLSAGEPWSEKKEAYDSRIAKAQSDYESEMEALAEKYTAALERTAEQLQENGDLQPLLAVKSELKRFAENTLVPDLEDDRLHAKVRAMRDVYLKTSRQSQVRRDQATRDLTNAYLTYLEGLQKSLTQQGKLQEAMDVSGEKGRVKTSDLGGLADGPTSGSKPDAEKQAPSDPAGALQIAWWGTKPGFLPDKGAISLWQDQFNHEGKNDIKSGALYCKGGRSLVRGMNEKLLEACKASGSLSLVIHFQSDDLLQRGPARMLSFSLDSDKRNFSLCQDGSRLVLRLRTTETGLNGTAPDLVLGDINGVKPQHVAVSYGNGKVVCALNGQLVSVQKVGGDFSNWEPCQLVVGNEWKVDRPWNGRVFGFEVHTTAMSEEEAVRKTKL